MRRFVSIVVVQHIYRNSDHLTTFVFLDSSKDVNPHSKYCCVQVIGSDKRIIGPVSWLRENNSKILWPNTNSIELLSKMVRDCNTEFDCEAIEYNCKILCYGETYYKTYETQKGIKQAVETVNTNDETNETQIQTNEKNNTKHPSTKGLLLDIMF